MSIPFRSRLPGDVPLPAPLPQHVEDGVDVHESEVLDVLPHVDVGVAGRVAGIVEHMVVAVVANHVVFLHHAEDEVDVLGPEWHERTRIVHTVVFTFKIKNAVQYSMGTIKKILGAHSDLIDLEHSQVVRLGGVKLGNRCCLPAVRLEVWEQNCTVSEIIRE